MNLRKERCKCYKCRPGEFVLFLANQFPQRSADFLRNTVSDMRIEYLEAVDAGNSLKSRFILIEYYVGFGFLFLRLLYIVLAKSFDLVIDSIADFPKRLWRKKSLKLEKPPFRFLLELADWLPKKQAEILIDEVDELRQHYYDNIKNKKYFKARFKVFLHYMGLILSGIRWILIQLKEIIGFLPKVD